MAEKTILVCDACGKPAAETVTIKVERGNFVKDLCATHVNELVAGARKPRPGRRKGSTSAAAARTSSGRKTGARKTAARKTTARKSTGRKRGRPRKAVAA
jgi:topoisomerase IA-like protein